jgi:hypothetical protein
VNDFSVAVDGTDDKGQALSTDAGLIADKDAAYMGATGSLLAGCGAAWNYCLEIKKMLDLSAEDTGTATGDTQFDGALNTAAANAASSAPKAVAGLLAATSKIALLVDKASTFARATSAVAQGLPFVATVSGIVTFGRSVRKAHRARKRYSAFRKILRAGTYHTEEMRHCLSYALGKTFRKTRTQGATAGAAITGASGGSIFGVTAIAGGANAWNPVGWVLLGVAAIGGTGIAGYKIYKRYTRKKRHAKREQKYGGIKTPTDLGTRLIKIASADHADKETAVLMLESFGVTCGELGDKRARHAAVEMVARHLN